MQDIGAALKPKTRAQRRNAFLGGMMPRQRKRRGGVAAEEAVQRLRADAIAREYKSRRGINSGHAKVHEHSIALHSIA